jgi:transcriptional regulator with XRE-family HTH domain
MPRHRQPEPNAPLTVRRGIGARIRAARRHLGLTQAALAEGIGLSPNFIAHIERGSRNPSLKTLADLSAFLEVPLAGFFKTEALPARLARERPLVRRIGRLLDQAPRRVLRMLVRLLEDTRPRA